MALRHRGHTHSTVDQAKRCEFTKYRKPDGSLLDVTKVDPTALRGVVEDGWYTVVLKGDNDYVTFRVRRQAEDDAFMPDCQIVSFLMGSDNERDYKSFAHLTEDGEVKVWKRYRGNIRLHDALRVLLTTDDVEGLEESYALRSSRCARCNRPLTVPASIHRGKGPVCAEKS